MKNLLLVLFCLSFIISCNTKEKYQGTWYDTIYYQNEAQEVPIKMVITKDSIHFEHPNFRFWESFAMHIEKNQLSFNQSNLKVEKVKDSLIINNYNIFSKNPIENVSKILKEDNLNLELNLPKIQNAYFKKYPNDNHRLIYYILFGKRLDNDTYSLQLNNNYADFEDLPIFLSEHHRDYHSPYPNSFLLIDKNSKMNDLEKLFYMHQKINQLKVSFINNISIKSNDSIGLYYEYQLIDKKLFPLTDKDNYSNKTLNFPLLPPPPPMMSTLENENSNISYYILNDNIIYAENKKINHNEFEKLVERSILNDDIIISLYDLESSYESFLKMIATMDAAYQKLRNKRALIKFNKPFNDLNNEEIGEIKMEIQMKHIWDYSIPHYKSIIENNNSFLGLKVKSMDSLFPK